MSQMTEIPADLFSRVRQSAGERVSQAVDYLVADATLYPILDEQRVREALKPLEPEDFPELYRLLEIRRECESTKYCSELDQLLDQKDAATEYVADVVNDEAIQALDIRISGLLNHPDCVGRTFIELTRHVRLYEAEQRNAKMKDHQSGNTI